MASAIDIARGAPETRSQKTAGPKRWLLTALAYLGLLCVVGVAALIFALLLGETHGGLLPDALRPFAFILAWVAVLVLPVLGARAAWRRLSS